MTIPKNILLISMPRSGTHLVKSSLAKHLEVRTKDVATDNIDLDEVNFYGSGVSRNFYSLHIDNLELWLKGKVERFNQIIENRNIHVVFLDRKDFTELVLSRAIAEQLGWKSNSPKFKKKNRLKKINLEKAYRDTVRLRYHNNLDKIGLTFHETIYYEGILEDGLFINNHEIPIEFNPPEADDLSVIRNPPKSESITNYDQVLKWMEEFSKVYNEDWVPVIRWG